MAVDDKGRHRAISGVAITPHQLARRAGGDELGSLAIVHAKGEGNERRSALLANGLDAALLEQEGRRSVHTELEGRIELLAPPAQPLARRAVALAERFGSSRSPASPSGTAASSSPPTKTKP